MTKRLPQSGSAGASEDLFEEISSVGLANLSVAKVKGHNSLKQVVAGEASLESYLGNTIADVFADIGAQLLACERPDRLGGFASYKLACRIALRLALIEYEGRRHATQEEPRSCLFQRRSRPAMQETTPASSKKLPATGF